MTCRFHLVGLAAASLAQGAFSLNAQESGAPCSLTDRPAACSRASHDDAWERISEELSEIGTEGVRRASADHQRRIAELQAEILQARREEEAAKVDGLATGALPADDSSAAPGWRRASLARIPRCDAREPADEKSRDCARYDDVLEALRGLGMTPAEACPLAAADAFGLDWVSASRWCIGQRTGARTYDDFVKVLTEHGASAGSACEAAQRYWNGLSATAAQEACAESRD